MISKVTLEWWYYRGIDDDKRGKWSLFYRGKDNRVYAEGKHSNDWNAEEEHEIGSAYLEGYNQDYLLIR